MNALVVLDLGDDLDALGALAERLAQLAHRLARADERGEHHVHVLLDAEPQVNSVLRRHRRQVHVSVGQVAALLRACAPREGSLLN